MLQFFSLPSPYLDFAVVNTNWTAVEHAAAKLEILRVQGLQPVIVRQPGVAAVIVVADPDRLFHGDDGCSGFSGIGMLGSEIFAPSGAPTGNLFHRIDREVGEYTHFEVGRDRVQVANDVFGYGQIFASQHPSTAIASNRLHLHKLVMEALGEPVLPDDAAVIAALFSNQQFFGQQEALSRTAIRGVTNVPVPYTVTLRKGRLSMVRKKEFEEAVAPQGGTYRDRLEAGVERVVANTAAALESSTFETVVLDMSGGKDSRMVLGAAVHALNWKDRVRFNTVDIPGSADLPIAAGIANMFGARFYEGHSIPDEQMSLNDNSTLWRSYFFGQYHRMGAGAWSSKGRNRSELALSGFNGEIYRAFWSNIAARHISRACDVREFAVSAVHGSALPGAYGAAHLDLVSTALMNEMAQYPASTVQGAVEDHYLHHRNRTHFGLRGFTGYHDRLTWSPLQSVDLMAATRMLPFDERRANRVIYDVMHKLHPVLAQIPFDGGSPFADMGHVSPTGSNTPLRVILDEDTTAWAEAKDAMIRRVNQRRAGKAPQMRWADWPGHIAHLATEAITSLENRTDIAYLLPSNLRGHLTETQRASPALGMQFASRILAVHDALC